MSCRRWWTTQRLSRHSGGGALTTKLAALDPNPGRTPAAGVVHLPQGSVFSNSIELARLQHRDVLSLRKHLMEPTLI
jgi:hypothetical protein